MFEFDRKGDTYNHSVVSTVWRQSGSLLGWDSSQTSEFQCIPTQRQFNRHLNFMRHICRGGHDTNIYNENIDNGDQQSTLSINTF